MTMMWGKLFFSSTLLLAVLGVKSQSEMFYVMEPFESTEYDWFMQTPSGGTQNLTLSQDALFGDFALEIKYTVEPSDNLDGSGVTEFGVIQPNRPHNCHGATHMSLWYKVLDLGSLSGPASIKLTLMDDNDCRTEACAAVPGDSLDHFLIMDHILGDSQEVDHWRELRVELGSQSGLHIDRLRGWKIQVAMEGVQGLNSINEVSLLVDQLSCVGGGDMFGAAFYAADNFTQAVQNEGWIEEYYQSDLARTETNLVMNQGVLDINYTVQQVESWGGFIGFSYMAPGPAYYNLSTATHLMLDYHVTQTLTVPGRAHLRIIIQDGSDCVDGCSDYFFGHERFYSFHSILDGEHAINGDGQILHLLEGSGDPASPFWLTGWSGIIGNGIFDTFMFKGYTLEFNIDSQGDYLSAVSGGITLSNMAAVFEDEDNNIVDGTDDGAGEVCVPEPGLTISESSPAFTRKEFQGNVCCETCHADPNCLYALSTGRDCFVASYLELGSIELLKSPEELATHTLFLDDTAEKRGDFCNRCECREADLAIDCRGRDLVILPKTFNHSWAPRVVDLRENPRLFLLGSNSLASVSGSLEQLLLPADMQFLGASSLDYLPLLTSVEYEAVEGSDENVGGGNVISEPDGIFGDVCCGRGLEVGSTGMSFCDITLDEPGVDATYMPFYQYEGAQVLQVLFPSSVFMSEAAESVEKCAEYCHVSNDCNFFSYDARLPNAEHACHLLADQGTSSNYVCCARDHFADEDGTLPGWTSGLPPRTRHELENAKVLIAPQNIRVDPSNGFKTHFQISLGSSPRRGSVWIEPRLLSTASNLKVSISPSRVALYDANTTATVHVEVSNVDSETTALALVIDNVVDSCDEAFTSFSQGLSAAETAVYVEIVPPEDELTPDSSNSNLVAIVVPLVAVFVIGLLMFIYFDHAQKKSDSVWQVKKSELNFGDPPEVVGAGTFGVVLLAEYRGTQVAVKRVIPPRTSKKGSLFDTKTFNSTDDSENGDDDNLGMVSGGGGHPGFTSGGKYPTMTSGQYNPGKVSVTLDDMEKGTVMRSQIARIRAKSEAAMHRKLKADFIVEMRHLSKLRHPCITTVMGAVIGRNEEPMLIMEYMDHGSLYDILHNETMILEGEILLPILRDISQGVRFLHAADPQVIHGDLKAQNILVDSRFRAKVADFGLSQKKNLGATGTPYWMAPELLRGESVNTPASDIYSIGIILYEVYSRRDPYEGEDPSEVLRLVQDKKVNKRPPIPLNCPMPVQNIMTDCLVDDPEKRPTAEELDLRIKRLDVDTAAPEDTSGAPKTTISLFDIFPPHIAEALQDGRKVEAEHKDCVTIFFSDIVGFTDISSTLEPRKVADMLDRLYLMFDDLSHNHDVFKVETIGDAYMAVTNLVKDQSEDHAKRIACFAIEAVEAANQTLIDTEDVSKGYVNIRVGFHSGPVVADVVGSRNPRYCLFGDTVNTASRMESNSAKNRIQCSKRSAKLLREQHRELPIRRRGKISVKGKGEMDTYWVNEGSGGSESFCVGGVARRRLERLTDGGSGSFSADSCEF